MPEPKSMSSEQLFAARDAVMKQGEAKLAEIEAAGREATEEEEAELSKWEGDAKDLHDRAHRQAKVEARRIGFQDLTKAAQELPEAPRGTVATGGRATILSDPKRGWDSAAAFYDGVVKASMPGAGVDRRLTMTAAAAGMSQGSAAGGGFAVPPEFSNVIWDGLRALPTNLLSRTQNYTVTGDSLTFPANAETSRATGSRYGGVQGYWIAEAGSITTSAPTLRGVKLEPHELAVLVPVTDKLLRNGPAIGQYVTNAATDEIDTLVGLAIVQGDGVGKPKGLLSSGALITVTRQTAALFSQQDVAKMWCRLHSRSMMNAVWLVDQSVLQQIMRLFSAVTNVAGSENVGGFSSTLYNPVGGVGWGTLVGRPIIVTEFGKQLGTTGDVILTDLSAYVTGTGMGGIDQQSSIHVYFATAQTAFRFMFAVDGQTVLQSAQTPLSGGDTVSTVLVLS